MKQLSIAFVLAVAVVATAGGCKRQSAATTPGPAPSDGSPTGGSRYGGSSATTSTPTAGAPTDDPCAAPPR